MTYPILSYKQLRTLTTREIKLYADSIGAIPESYGRNGLIDAIEKVQPTRVADTDVLSIDDYIDLEQVECPTEQSVQAAFVDAETLRQTNVCIGQIDPDGDGDEIYDVARNDERLTAICYQNGSYIILEDWHLGEYYDSPESAAVAWLLVWEPTDTLVAAAAARHIVAERMALPDYM